MENVGSKEEGIPLWLYGAIGGVTVAVASFGTYAYTFFSKQRVAKRDAKLNEEMRQTAIAIDIERLTPRE